MGKALQIEGASGIREWKDEQDTWAEVGHLVKQAQGIKEEEEKCSGSLEIVGHVLGAQMMDSSRDQSPGATQQSQDFYTRSSQNAQ